MADTSEKEFDSMIGVNLKAVYFSFVELIPRMKKQGGGQIINISSMAGKQGNPGLGVYSASKAAMNILADSTSGEVRNDKIKISVLAPASVDTGMLDRLLKEAGKKRSSRKKITPDDVAAATVHMAKQDDNTWLSYLDLRPLLKRK